MYRLAHLGSQAVVPGGFREHAPAMGVAAPGNAALHPFVAAAVFAGREAEEVHQRTRVVKPAEVAHFGHQRHGNPHLHAPQTHECTHHRFPLPARQGVFHCLGEPLQPFRRVIDRVDVFLNGSCLIR